MNQKPKKSTIINICIIPNEAVAVRCVLLSQSLASGSTLFALDGSRFAHMTVFMARFANESIQKVVDNVEAALKPVSTFRCQHAGYFLTEGRYLEISYRRSPELIRLHESIINHVSRFRINPGDPYEEGYFTPYTEEQQQNARETGYDLARNLFRPHITLTRYREGGVPSAFPALPETMLSFELSRVCVYKADDNGAVYERMHEFHVR
jgi:2'-5' RNA ligase